MPKKALAYVVKASVASRQQRRAALAALLLTLAVAAGGCSSNDSGPNAAGEVKAAESDCGKQATTAYEDALEAPEIELPPAFDATKLAGEKFAYVGFINNAVVQTKFNAFAEAIESVGAEAVFFDGKGRPDVMAQSFQSAIAQKVSGIVTDGYDATAVAASAVKDAESAGIPIVNTYAGDPSNDLPDGITAAVAPGIFATGAIQGDYALARTECELNALAIYTTVSQLNVDAFTGLQDEVKKLCDECTVTGLDVNAATYQTDLAPQVQTALQRDPSINAVILSGGDVFAPYVASAVQAVQSDAIIVGAEGSGLGDAIKGNGVVADLLWPPSDLAGYFSADAVMRAAAGDPMNLAAPIRLVDSSNWGDDGDVSALFPGSDEAKEQFRKLWGEQ